MFTIKRRLLPAVAVLLLLAVLFVIFSPTPVKVETTEVMQRPLVVVVEEQGRTRAKDPYTVAAPISGRLLRSTLEAGDKVQSGQTIAQIAIPPNDLRTQAVLRANLVVAQASEAAAKAALLEAESNNAKAMREEERRQELAKKNLSSAEEVEQFRQVAAAARAQMQSAKANLQAATAGVESARSYLLGSNKEDEGIIQSITTPTNGTVYQVFEESERVVQAGTPLFEISNDDALEIVVDLLTQDAVKVAVGAPMQITGWGGNEALDGTVTRIEPAAFTKVSALGVEEQRVNVIGIITSPHSSLGAEYRVEVGIVVWSSDAVLAVPSSAIFQRDGRWQVFVVHDAHARLREVMLGHRSRDYAEVLAGLEPGEHVVEFPSDLVSDGVLVQE